MAIVRKKQFRKFEIDIVNKTLSISSDIVLEDNGVLLLDDNGLPVVTDSYYRGFVPGEFDTVKEWVEIDDLHPAYVFLQSFWTQQVIDDYRAKLAALESEGVL